MLRKSKSAASSREGGLDSLGGSLQDLSINGRTVRVTKKGKELEVIPWDQHEGKCFCSTHTRNPPQATGTSKRSKRRKHQRKCHACSSLKEHLPVPKSNSQQQPKSKSTGNMWHLPPPISNSQQQPKSKWTGNVWHLPPPISNSQQQPKPKLTENIWRQSAATTQENSLKKIMRNEQKKLFESSLVLEVPKMSFQPIKIKHNQALIEQLMGYFQFRSCLEIPEYDLNRPYSLLKITTSYEYDTIRVLFNKTMLSYKLGFVKQVINPFLLLQYLLKKRVGYRELLLYHGTKIENVDSICTDNFDWRLVARHKYGWGVSFSTTPYYASHYCDESGTTKVMFAVKVMVRDEWCGNCETQVPADEFDTTTNKNENVYVKYDDCSFYPAYVIYYSKN